MIIEINTLSKMKNDLKPGKDFIGVAVFALIFNNKDQILFVDHIKTEKKNEDYADMWSMPGGTIEFGETSIETLKREIKEELGIEIYNEEYISYNEYMKDNKHWLALNFTAKTNQEPKNCEPLKIQAIQLFDKDKIPKNITNDSRNCLKTINIL
jgi:mutator protein MutT